MALQPYEYDPRRLHRASVRVQKAGRRSADLDTFRIDFGEIDRLIAREFEMPMEEVRIIRFDCPGRWRQMQTEAARSYAQRCSLRVPMSTQEATPWKEYVLCAVMVPCVVAAFALWLIAHTFLSGVFAIGLLVIAGICVRKLWKRK